MPTNDLASADPSKRESGTIEWVPMSYDAALAALKTAHVRAADVGVTVTGPDRNGVIVVRSDQAEIRILRHSPDDDSSDRAVLVETELAEQLSGVLAGIGDRMRAHEAIHGVAPDSDLRTEYEQPWRDTQVAVARTAVVLLARLDLLDNCPPSIQRAVDGAVFDRNAGCEGCGGCTPGVRLGERLRRDSSVVTLYVCRRRPEKKITLTAPQVQALRAAAAWTLIREEIRYPYRHYVRGNDAVKIRPATVDALFRLNLVQTGERSGSKRPIVATEAGRDEVLARA